MEAPSSGPAATPERSSRSVGPQVAIQGIEGSNHHKVAMDYYGTGVDTLECLSFDTLVDCIVDGRADRGVMAIENSIAGSIIPNYALLHRNGLRIVGEVYHSIAHYLMACPGQDISDILEVHSHPMALLQCKAYLKEVPWMKRVESSDTAEPARRIGQASTPGIAAIAPLMAAERYGLEVLARDIQTIKNNATRFLIVDNGAGDDALEGVDKASIRFVTEHKRGSLATVLNVMSDCKLNLTKIQSLPIIETPWKYAFFVDVTFDAPEYFEKAASLLRILSEDFTVLGTYKNRLTS